MRPAPQEQWVAAMRLAIARSGQQPGGDHACPYLPDRTARELAFRVDGLAPGWYAAMMDLNFRRSGRIAYRPECDGCHECRAIRIPVEEFAPNRTQRRCWQRNRDLEVTIGPPELTDEKHALYSKYLAIRHDRQMDDSRMALEEFLYVTPICSREVVFRRAGRLVAIGILDVEPQAFSTVYCYYDPELAADSPGTFNILWSLDYARREAVPYVYLGYYIHACRKMNYKLQFRPCELLNRDGTWERKRDGQCRVPGAEC